MACTVDMVYTVDIVYTVDFVYTNQTDLHCLAHMPVYEKVSDVPESRVWFASKNLTPCRMH